MSTGTIENTETSTASAATGSTAPQFFTAPAEVPPKPQYACIGKVGEVGECKAPEGDGKFHSLSITLDPAQSGLKKTVFLRFWPEVFTTDPKSFTPDFNVDKGKDPVNDAKRDYYWCLKMSIVSTDGRAHLQGLIGALPIKDDAGNVTYGGPAWDAFIADVKAAHEGSRIAPERFRQIILKHTRSKNILYVLKQASQKTDGGDKVYKDDYEVSSIEALTRESIAAVQKRAAQSAGNADIRRRVELRFTVKTEG